MHYNDFNCTLYTEFRDRVIFSLSRWSRSGAVRKNYGNKNKNLTLDQVHVHRGMSLALALQYTCMCIYHYYMKLGAFIRTTYKGRLEPVPS